MMTATNTDADANATPAAEQVCGTQPLAQPQPHAQAPIQPADQSVDRRSTHLPTLEITTVTGAAAPVRDHAETPDHEHEQGQGQETDVTTMIAREGSELAQRLRASGWIARAGWRSSDATGRPVWHLRFEQPSTTFNS